MYMSICNYSPKCVVISNCQTMTLVLILLFAQIDIVQENCQTNASLRHTSVLGKLCPMCTILSQFLCSIKVHSNFWSLNTNVHNFHLNSSLCVPNLTMNMALNYFLNDLIFTSCIIIFLILERNWAHCC